jgi:hypothetical protein
MFCPGHHTRVIYFIILCFIWSYNQPGKNDKNNKNHVYIQSGYFTCMFTNIRIYAIYFQVTVMRQKLLLWWQHWQRTDEENAEYEME